MRQQRKALNSLLQGAGAICCKQWSIFLDEEIVDLSVDTKTNVADEILTNTYSDNRESKGILDKTKDFIQDQSKKLLDKQIDIKSPTRNAYTSGDLGNGKGFNFVANRTPLQRANNLKLNNEGLKKLKLIEHYLNRN